MFDLIWRDGRYFVSKPNIDSQSVVPSGVAAALEVENAALKRELAQVTADFQAACDHDFVTEDHSFSHEFGTEKIFVCRCTKCGKDAEPGDVPDEEPERDWDRERRLREDSP